MSSVLGHAGGWDEVLLFATPVIAVLLWVRWAEKRARARREEQAGDGEEQAGGGEGHAGA